MVWVLAAGLALVALGLGIKVALLRHGIKALRQDLVERLVHQDDRCEG